MGSSSDSRHPRRRRASPRRVVLQQQKHAASVWRACGLVHVAGAAPCDILTFGEIKAPSTAPAMVLIGVCSMAGPRTRLRPL